MNAALSEKVISELLNQIDSLKAELAAANSCTLAASASASLRIGGDVPNFKADTSMGELDFHEYLGDSW
jgi:hypothetical protein